MCLLPLAVLDPIGKPSGLHFYSASLAFNHSSPLSLLSGQEITHSSSAPPNQSSPFPPQQDLCSSIKIGSLPWASIPFSSLQCSGVLFLGAISRWNSYDFVFNSKEEQNEKGIKMRIPNRNYSFMRRAGMGRRLNSVRLQQLINTLR